MRAVAAAVLLLCLLVLALPARAEPLAALPEALATALRRG